MDPAKAIRVAAIGLLGLCLAVALATAGSSAATPPAKSERERNELLGPVETILLEFQHAPHEGETLEYARDRIQFDAYERQGSIIRQTVFNPDFVDELQIERIDALTVVTGGSIRTDLTEHISCDAQSNVIERAIYYGRSVKGELFQIHRYTYDAAGRMIEEDLYDRDGTQIGVTHFTRDHKGGIVQEESSYNGQPAPIQIMAGWSSNPTARVSGPSRTMARISHRRNQTRTSLHPYSSPHGR